MSLICKNCGASLKDGTRFCTECGTETVQPLNISCNYYKEDEKAAERIEAENSDAGDEQSELDAEDEAVDEGAVWGTAASLDEVWEKCFVEEKYVEDVGIRQKFFRYDNRINRKRYFQRWLQLTTLVTITMVLVTMLDNLKNEMLSTIAAGILLLVTSISMVSMIFLNTRRLHDLGQSGIWGVLIMVPWLNAALYLYLFFVKGNEGANRYGPDPLQKSND